MKDLFRTDESIIDGRLHVFHAGRWMPVPSGAADGDTPDPAPTDPPADPAPADPAPTDPPADPAAAPANGDDADADALPSAPADGAEIEAAPEDSLRETHAALITARADAIENRNPARARQAQDEANRIAAEIQRRRDVEAADLAELTALEADGPAALPDAVPVLAGQTASAGQLAGARRAATGGQPAAQQQPPTATPARPRAAIVAAAGNDIARAGAEIDLGQLGAAIERSKRSADRVILASIPAYADDPTGLPALLNDRNGAPMNDALIRESVADWRASLGEADPLPAAARLSAICGPPEIIRDIPDAFSTATPVADMFPSRPGGRGSWTFTPSGVLADVDGAVNLWSLAGANNDQDAVDPEDSSTWKPCATYDCPDFQTANLEAIVTCVQYDLTLDMSSPERVRNLNNAVGALRARIHEGRMLQRIDQLSSPFVFSGDYGALPVFVEAINSLIPTLSFWNRQEPGQYDMILPLGVAQVLTIDRAARAYGAEQEVGDVMAYLRANLEGVRRVVVALDPSLGGEPGTFRDPLPGLGNQAAAGSVPFISGATYRARLIAPEAAIYAETGEINAGTLRDVDMIRQNKTGYFTEQFFALEKHGPQPWATVDVELCADGSRAGLVDPVGCRHS